MNYDEYRDQQNEISRERSRAGREIGPLPKVVDPYRRARCLADVYEFMTTYFPFTLGDRHNIAVPVP